MMMGRLSFDDGNSGNVAILGIGPFEFCRRGFLSVPACGIVRVMGGNREVMALSPFAETVAPAIPFSKSHLNFGDLIGRPARLTLDPQRKPLAAAP